LTATAGCAVLPPSATYCTHNIPWTCANWARFAATCDLVSSAQRYNVRQINSIAAKDLGLLVHLDAGGTQQLGAVETLGRGVAVLAREQLADVAERVLGRSLAADQLRQTRHEEVVGELFDAADRKLCPLAAQRARELPVVRVPIEQRQPHLAENTVLQSSNNSCGPDGLISYS